jgi:hypothetical protein
VLCEKTDFYAVNTRYGAKDLPSFKNCIALNMLLLYDCLPIGFGTGSVQLLLFFLVIFPQWSILCFIHPSPTPYNLGSGQHSEIKHFCQRVCLSISFRLKIFFLSWSATFICGRKQNNFIHLSRNYSIWSLISSPFPVFHVGFILPST